MPRYFITIADGFQSPDEEGSVLPDRDALAKLLRETLAAVLHDESKGSHSEFRAEATDETGRTVMTAVVTLLVVEQEGKR